MHSYKGTSQKIFEYSQSPTCVHVYSIVLMSGLLTRYKISGPSENDPRATERRQTLEQERVEMEVLRLKVEHLDFKNDEHKTPLHLAAMSGNME